MSGLPELPDTVERVARELREDILRHRYRPGERLPSERDLAERLQVNRGAVREAFRVLSQLGLVVILPGGARAAPVEEASLDVLGHLLALEDLPDPELVDQVLEAHGVLAAGWLRVLLDRGADEEIEAVRELLQQVVNEPPGGDHAALLNALVQRLADAQGNLVLQLIRRGMKLHFWERIEAAGATVQVKHDLIVPMARELDAALAERDGARASDLAYSLMKLHRQRSVEALERQRFENGRRPEPDRAPLQENDG